MSTSSIEGRAFAIADATAHATVIRVCQPASSRHDRVEWFDLATCAARHRAELDDAIAYLEARGDRAPMRLVRSRAFPQRMVRFERAR